MPIFSRTMQKRLLLRMRDRFPDFVHDFEEEKDDGRLLANIAYMEGHGLCQVQMGQSLSGPLTLISARITAKGIDFLEDDGGLAAILGVVTVKFHADTIRDLLADKIETSPIAPEEKSRLKKVISSLSEATLKSATTELVKSGLDNIPNALLWFHHIAGI